MVNQYSIGLFDRLEFYFNVTSKQCLCPYAPQTYI